VTRSSDRRVVLRVADAGERDGIYRLRHRVFADELGQHQPNQQGVLTDELDGRNVFIAASRAGELLGFVSVTPPGSTYSIDKYVDRSRLPFVVDDGTYEVRLLAVAGERRGGILAMALMYAALRWVESRGGNRVVAVGREEVLPMYRKAGLELLGHRVRSGAVTFELMAASTSHIRANAGVSGETLERLAKVVDWQLDMPFRQPTGAFHGGAFFDAIGVEFDHLERRDGIINADVLDAWFPPRPGRTDGARGEPRMARTHVSANRLRRHDVRNSPDSASRRVVHPCGRWFL